MGLLRCFNRIIATLFGTKTRMALSSMGVAGLLAVIPVSVVFAAQDETEPTTPAAEQGVEQEEVTELPVPREPRGQRFTPGKLIVKLKEQAPSSALEELNRRHGGRTDKQLAPNLVPGLYRVNLAPGLAVRDAVGRYRSSGNVEYVEPDFTRFALLEPTDAYYTNGRLWGLNNTGQNSGTNDADIDAPEAWDTTTGDPATVVAVIDSGVNYFHPDLDGNQRWRNPNETNNGSDDDGNRLTDDIRGWDWVNDDNNPMDDHGHGSHVAGTIAAEANNSTATTGGAAVGVNWNAQIMPLKFLRPVTLPDGSQGSAGSTADAISALDYAVDKGAKLSNNSWGGGPFSQGLYDAIERAGDKGHLFVAAAGNNGANNDTTPHFPASYGDDSAVAKYPDPVTNDPLPSLDNVIAVAATDRNDNLASFSNYGATSVDLAAPGVSIWSTYRPTSTSNNTYASLSGTSMAAPHVTGVAALIKSRESAWDAAGIKKRLLESMEKIDNLTGKLSSEGRLNAHRAIDTTPPTKPSITDGPDSNTNSTSASFSFSGSTDNRSTSVSYECKLDSGSFEPCTSPKSYSNLSEGSHTFSVQAVDEAGNRSEPASYSWYVDATPSETTIDKKPANPTNSTSASFEFSSGEQGSTFECKLDDAAFEPCTSPKSYSNLSEGSHTFQVRAKDAAGNVDATPDSYSWYVDLTAPSAPTIDTSTAPSDQTNSTSASFSFDDSTDNHSRSVSYECSTNGTDYTACTSPQSYTKLSEGSHTFYVRAKDEAGNVSDAASYSWTVDATLPTVESTYPTDEQRRVPKTANVTAAFSEAMNEATITGDNFTLEFVRQGEVTLIPATVSYDSETYTATLDPTDTLRSGIYRVTVKTAVEDEAGNALAEEKVWLFSV